MTSTPSRRDKLESMLAQDPDNVFLRYGLALEFAAAGDVQGGVERLAPLLELDPPYVPAFFMSAQHLAALGQQPAARRVLERGIAAARTQGDAHAAGEMTEFLAELGG